MSPSVRLVVAVVAVVSEAAGEVSHSSRTRAVGAGSTFSCGAVAIGVVVGSGGVTGGVGAGAGDGGGDGPVSAYSDASPTVLGGWTAPPHSSTGVVECSKEVALFSRRIFFSVSSAAVSVNPRAAAVAGMVAVAGTAGSGAAGRAMPSTRNGTLATAASAGARALLAVAIAVLAATTRVAGAVAGAVPGAASSSKEPFATAPAASLGADVEGATSGTLGVAFSRAVATGTTLSSTTLSSVDVDAGPGVGPGARVAASLAGGSACNAAAGGIFLVDGGTLNVLVDIGDAGGDEVNLLVLACHCSPREGGRLAHFSFLAANTARRLPVPIAGSADLRAASVWPIFGRPHTHPPNMAAFMSKT